MQLDDSVSKELLDKDGQSNRNKTEVSSSETRQGLVFRVTEKQLSS